MKLLRSFETAVEFLTVFHVGVDPPADLTDVGRASWAFPIVGGLIGGALVGFQLGLEGYLPDILLSVMTVALWIGLTGGLHLDGWADCCDALPASVAPGSRFRIIKDSRLGAFGALGLIFLLALKTTAVASDRMPILMLFIAPIIGRTVMVLVSHGSRYLGEGMAANFLYGLSDKSVTWAFFLCLLPTLAAGWMGLAALCAAYAVAWIFKRIVISRMGGINGDAIGAMCELAEVVALIVACWRW